MWVKDQFSEYLALYLSFGTCLEVDIRHLCSSSIHKYNISMLSCLKVEEFCALLRANATMFFSTNFFLVVKILVRKSLATTLRFYQF